MAETSLRGEEREHESEKSSFYSFPGFGGLVITNVIDCGAQHHVMRGLHLGFVDAQRSRSSIIGIRGRTVGFLVSQPK